ncbi:glycosyltransferase family 2 protein [Gautieria morchelliformis]|nr:glycosyltransferase family 2 protein [Gautieria morchelliformis]
MLPLAASSHSAVSNTANMALNEIYLVTGGAGFLGSHIAKRLHSQGAYVRIADRVPAPEQLEASGFSQYFCGDLRDLGFCTMVMQNVHTVIHMAANMGGMGAIHEKNDFIIYRENKAITVNVLETALKHGVCRFLYASSACVYPTDLQSSSDKAVRLREAHVWSSRPPSPQGLYGLEKLEGEMLLLQFLAKLDIKIARFHNVYGPGGTWQGGREKAPAAFARKAVATKLMQEKNPHFEIWGDGSQRRSFLYVSDAVEAVIRLLDVEGYKTLNIGSENDVPMQELACLALDSTDMIREHVTFNYVPSRPVGVISRTSNNELVTAELAGWVPVVSLAEGMRRTTEWVEGQVRKQMSHLVEPHLSNYLETLQQSVLVDLEHDAVKFGIILPVTSSGTTSPGVCLDNLKVMAASLDRTTWRDTHSQGGTRFDLSIYLALDHDDEFLLDGSPAENILRMAGISDITRVVCNYPKGSVCSIWRECAKHAWKDGCHYITLLGDDIELLDEGWLRDMSWEFSRLAEKTTSPFGFGCVAFTDISFPGMPTFPVLHRTHMEIFDEVVPDCFVNQDGDPYLFQLYRRFGCSRMIPSRIRNGMGGEAKARYDKKHAAGWTYEPLQAGTKAISDWIDAHGYQIKKLLTLDVVIPSYRVQMSFLKPILALKASESCSVMWIVIIDDPASPTIPELMRDYGARPDVRVRVHPSNLGASASRNRGLAESAAEWVHFLDDDVIPHPDLLIRAEAAIRAHPEAAGFVGNVQFPSADSIFTSAVHLSGGTYFWDIAMKLREDLPWGVTANLLARRDVKDGVCFDGRFPKTGGGEDIDFCVRKRDWFVSRGKEGFWAAPEVIVTHPWWNEGARRYRRFYMWSKGDGALVSMFPQHCYLDHFPNSAELIMYSFVFGSASLFLSLGSLAALGYLSIVAVILANNLHDLYHHIRGHIPNDPRSTVSGLRRILAIMEGGIIRIASEGGRLVGQIERGEFIFLQPRQRFDWFVGRVGTGPIDNEKMNSRQRFSIWLVLILAAWLWLSERK